MLQFSEQALSRRRSPTRYFLPTLARTLLRISQKSTRLDHYWTCEFIRSVYTRTMITDLLVRQALALVMSYEFLGEVKYLIRN
jgi:hypothetical protein